MKGLLQILLFFMATYSTTSAVAETTDIHSKNYLLGKWIASCGVEYVDIATVRHCQICPFEIDTKDDKKAEIKDVLFTFQPDSLQFEMNGVTEKVSYSLHENDNSFQFVLNEKVYNFRVFYVQEKVILVDPEGLVILLVPTL